MSKPTIVAGEECLGEQRVCVDCHEPWPLDQEFFAITKRRHGRAVYSVACRACRAERRKPSVAPARPRRVSMADVPLSSSKLSPERKAWKRHYDAALLATLTPEQREARRARRRAIRQGVAA